MAEKIITKKIDKIAFGVLSPDVLKKLSTVNVTTPEIYDTDGYPVEKGLMDPAMGVIDPGMKCKACGSYMKTCLGHFGNITLSKPVVHILFVDYIKLFLNIFCKECGRTLAAPDKLDKLAKKAKTLRAENNLEKAFDIIKDLKTAKECPYCNTEVTPVKLVKPTSFFEGETQLWPNKIRERLEKIPDDDLVLLGLDPLIIRPEHMILIILAIPPITTRSSITLESGERSEDDLTHKLSDIVRVNQRLLENINAGAPEIIVEDLWDLLQYHVTTFFNNKVAQIPHARHRTKRELKTLAQRLEGKEGRFRYNLAGKRVNFCARSVISPDPYINIEEIGVPKEIAKELTVPEKVTEWNIEWLKSLIKSQRYPAANYIITGDGKRRKITNETISTILEEIKIGWIVERQLLDDDIVVFNRQPSLHRLSMMGHRVKIVLGKTFRINPLACLPYNADFDGDEMNIHLPQTEESRAEAENILLLRHQIITPRYGLSIIGNIEDNLLGLYYLTKNMFITKDEAYQLLLATGIDKELPKPAKKDLWSGKQIFSLILPEGLNFKYQGKVITESGKIAKGEIIIKNGELIDGVIDKTLVGPEGGLLIHKVHSGYGVDVTNEFLGRCNQLGLAVSRRIAHTISFYDLDLSEKETEEINKILKETENKANDLIRRYESGKITALPGKTEKETFEVDMLKILSVARSYVGDLVEKEAKEDSTLVNSARAGAGDKVLNIALMSGFIGQQAPRGERINFGYTGRTLSHFRKDDLSPESHGFIKSGFAKGIKPTEFFFNAIAGRESYMDTAMRTPKSGYMQRRLINALQDLKVEYDRTIRDSGKKIIQFSFGGDDIDVSKSDGGKIDVNI